MRKSDLDVDPMRSHCPMTNPFVRLRSRYATIRCIRSRVTWRYLYCRFIVRVSEYSLSRTSHFSKWCPVLSKVKHFFKQPPSPSLHWTTVVDLAYLLLSRNATMVTERGMHHTNSYKIVVDLTKRWIQYCMFFCNRVAANYWNPVRTGAFWFY